MSGEHTDPPGETALGPTSPPAHAHTEPPITPAEASHRFNLSSWTLRHQALVVFILVLVTFFGVLS